MLILGIIEILAESMTMADKTGVGANLLMEFIK
jgi:3-hydroxyisobutyrate dehydrogenase-like beta-hydroxyacid dehydrogenase